MNDPTGFSSPLGQIIVGLALLTSLIVLLRWFWTNRRRWRRPDRVGHREGKHRGTGDVDR